MVSKDGRWTVVFNGEIYNYISIRAFLLKFGARFETSSDTEVLVELIANRGFIQALETIEGMFSIAAVDSEHCQLWLARDRFGEKPLFLDRREGRFRFCSELTPLLMAGCTRPTPEAQGVVSILRFGFPWPGSTAVKGVVELKPGQWLRRSANAIEESRMYWQLPDQIDTEAGPARKCQKIFLDLIHSSVKERLISDVPLGIWLSGGIDSAMISYAASSLNRGLSAITVGFRNRHYDETSLARLTANHLGLTLYEASGEVLKYSGTTVDELLYHYGQPFGDTSSIPTRVLARLAKKHFTVALSGDGGDELFCGYLSFRRLAELSRYGMGKIGRAVSRHLSPWMPPFSSWERFRRGMDLNSSLDFGLFGYVFEGVFDDSQILALIRGTEWDLAGRDFLAEKRAETSDRWARTKEPFLALSLQLLATSFPQHMLMKTDRMSMAESLEVRSPFLDSRVASYALSLPTHIKMRGLVGKALLRECLADHIPREVLCAPKRGFQLPLRDWLGDAFRRDLEFEINEYKRDSGRELNLNVLESIVRINQSARGDAHNFRSIHRLWLIFIYLRWRRTWCQQWSRPLKLSSETNSF